MFRTKADVEAGKLHGELKDAKDKIESLTRELESAKGKITDLEESQIGKNKLIVELNRQVQHQKDVSNMLTSSLDFETWKAKVYKGGAQSAHDYAEAKFDEQITKIKQEANSAVLEAREEAIRVVSDIEQTADHMIREMRQETEIAKNEVEFAKEEIQFAVEESNSAQLAATAAKRIAAKRGMEVINAVNLKIGVIKMLEKLAQGTKGETKRMLHEYVDVFYSEVNALVKDLDPELKQEFKKTHN